MTEDEHKQFFQRRYARRPLLIVLVYAVLSGIYIFYSDILVHTSFGDANLMEQVSIAKGWIYVALSATLLYWMISRLLKNVMMLSSQRQALEDESFRILGLLQSIAANSTDSIYAKNLEGRYLFFNRQSERVTGKSADEVIGQNDSALFPPEQAALVEANDRLVIQSGVTQTFEEVVPTVEGTRDFLTTKSPLLDKEGKLVGVFGISRDVTEQRSAEKALRESERSYRSLTEQAPFIVYRSALDAKSTTLYVSPQIEVFGYPAAEWLVRHELWSEIMHPEDQPKVFEALAQAKKVGAFSVEYRMKMPNGDWGYFLDEARVINDDQGNPYCLQGMMLDVTERKKAETELKLFEQTFYQAGLAMAISDPVTNVFRAVNPVFAAERGYQVDELIGKPIMMVFPPDVQSIVAAQIKLWELHGHGLMETFHVRRDGTRFPVLLDVTVAKGPDGKPLSRLAYARDMSERDEASRRINYLAYYDSLTGLPNRQLMIERLSLLSSMAMRDGVTNALVIVDLDHFKVLNDARGHSKGDALLKALAERLGSLLRDDDTLARMGGDEFGVLLHLNDQVSSTAGHHASTVVAKFQDAIQQTFNIDDDKFYLQASFGITLFPLDGDDNVDLILKRADTALQRAKESGRNQIVFFDPEMGKAVEHFFQIERELHLALSNDELVLYLQPQVNSSGTMVSAEALIRWQHPERGLLMPGMFIPVAEESDLIVEIGKWVMVKVCELLASPELADWPGRIAVNISARHFAQKGFVEWVKSVLRMTGAEPLRLTFEVTESLVIDNVSEVVAKMSELNLMGIHFSIDDFGTGYSSLAYLKRLPLHELKIDKTFVQDAPDDPDDGALVEAILAIANKLRLRVVAEGVETQEQADFLASKADVIMQGFLYARPEPVASLIQRLPGHVARNA